MSKVATSEVREMDEEIFHESKTFQERLNDMPTYTMGLSQLQTMYTSLKDTNEVLKTALNTGEICMNQCVSLAKPVVWAATTSTLTLAKPIVGKVNDPGIIFVLLLL